MLEAEQEPEETHIHDKHTFIECLKKWATLDKQNKLLNEKLQEIRLEKRRLNKQLCGYMERANITHKPIETNEGDIRLVEKKDYSPLTFSYIEDCLKELIETREHIDAILDYLYENREVRIVKELQRCATRTKT